MVLETRCYWELSPTINGFFKYMANARPSMDWIKVRTSSEWRVDCFVGNQVDPALDWLAIFVFIPLNHRMYDKKNAVTFKNSTEKISGPQARRKVEECIPQAPALIQGVWQSKEGVSCPPPKL